MINPAVLLSDLKKLLGQLEADLRERADEVPTLGKSLRSAYERAKQAERTAQPFETWREEYLTQAAVAWVLACVFVRFVEDNILIDTPLLAGSGLRLGQAKDERTLYFQQRPTDSDREYLHHVFRKVEALPAAAPLFDERHNPLWAYGISGDGATLLVEFWQRIDPATGVLAHDFADSALNTRFLGDLYQDLSEAARKKYALLQTPEFVEEFILDRTLTPAIAEFGLAEVRLIDPACGSGHFLLGAFHRLLHEWQKREPAVNVRELVQRALDAVHGVDLNPYAVAIARFRLLIAALTVSAIHRLADAPAFSINLATGDSLLHGPRPGNMPARQMYLDGEVDPLRHVYDTEDAEELRRILGARYHVVVGNPPYISVKDRAVSEAYRRRFGSCHMKYSLAVPFMERFFDLALAPQGGDTEPAGYIGTITANSFMKREFGKKLIEEYIPRWDVTHIVDTSGAYIPGHGTPTVILFGRHRKPVSKTVRAVLGIRGEPQRPENPSRGHVWSAIVTQLDQPGSQSAFVSVADAKRDSFHSHPWSLGGGGAVELKDRLNELAESVVGDSVSAIGITSVTGEDDVYILPNPEAATRLGIAEWRVLVTGDRVRDWLCAQSDIAVWVYDANFRVAPLDLNSGTGRYLWPFKKALSRRKRFGTPMLERGLTWYEWQELYVDKLRTPLSIVFAFVATHNHFVLDRGGKVFNRTAPVIKLATGATEEDHLVLVGLLNSSTACFWMKQTFFDRGNGGIGGGIANEEWERFFEHDGTKLHAFPLPRNGPIDVARALDQIASEERNSSPDAVLASPSRHDGSLRTILSSAEQRIESLRKQRVALQEELDWECYHLYGLVQERLCHVVGEVPSVKPGERAFEIVMARQIAAGSLETAWFERHASTPTIEIPTEWPSDYRELVNRRIALIESDANISMIERPEFKRRWNSEPWVEQQAGALRKLLLARLEAPALWSGVELTSVGKLSDRVRRDAEFMEAAELYRGRADYDLPTLVGELVSSDAVPFLPILVYTSSGLRKRAAWEQVWELQRRNGSNDHVDEIPLPPHYKSADFLDSTFWSLRGKLDVARERFISYPHAEREADQTPVVGWAGWDHLQRAKALAAYYVRMKEQEGWPPERLKAFIAGLLESIPWLKQWHNDLDPAYGIGMGDYFAGLVDEEARALGFTLDDVRAWQPPARNPRRRRRTSV